MMTFEYESILTALIVILGFLVVYKYVIRTPLDWPPCNYGRIPWLGCAIEFGKAPLVFIAKMKEKHGSLFTLYVAGERMTFLLDQNDFHHFFSSDSVSFQQAVQGPVQKTGSIPPWAFQKYHTTTHDTVRNCLALGRLDNICDKLCHSFRYHISKIWGDSGKEDLYYLIQQAMYAGVMDNLFGHKMMPTASKEEISEFSKYFVEFDDKFEYASRLPPIFLRRWAEAKAYLLNHFKNVVTLMQQQNEEPVSVVEHLISKVDEQFAPNFSLLLLWASLANAIPITFWTVVSIISDENILKKALQEIRDCFTTKIGDGKITTADISQLTYIKWCTLEAIRLHSPGVIARKVVKDIKIKETVIPSGDLLLLSPYWSHRNEELFPQADKFLPERWSQVDVTKNQFLDGFVAFGGGRYQCPGKWFALLEIQLFIALLLDNFNIKLIAGLPAQRETHIVGTQTPCEPCPVIYSTTT